MGRPQLYQIILLVVLITLSMLFSISESSILGMNRLRLSILKKKKDRRALRISKLLEKKEELINTLLISNDLVNIFTSSIIASFALQIFGDSGVGYATLAATVLLLIFGEITPKTISTRCPDKIAYGLSGFVKIVTIIMKPLVIVITFISKWVLRIFGIKTEKKNQSYTEEDIKTFFDLSEENGLIEESENRMMSQVFKFSDLEAQDIMVPRTKIRAVNEEIKFSEILELSERTGFSRFPVYKKSIDDITGVIYLRDLIKYKSHPSDFDLKKVMRPPLFIPGTKKMSSVQSILFDNCQSIAIIIDEYSGTDGILTEKDISREIFALPGDKSLRGKVFDFDSVENKDDFEVNGLVLLKVICEAFHLDLDSDVNETIGGWVTEKLGRIAVAGDKVECGGRLFIVQKVQSNRIERLRILKKQETEEKNS